VDLNLQARTARVPSLPQIRFQAVLSTSYSVYNYTSIEGVVVVLGYKNRIQPGRRSACFILIVGSLVGRNAVLVLTRRICIFYTGAATSVLICILELYSSTVANMGAKRIQVDGSHWHTGSGWSRGPDASRHRSGSC